MDEPISVISKANACRQRPDNRRDRCQFYLPESIAAGGGCRLQPHRCSAGTDKPQFSAPKTFQARHHPNASVNHQEICDDGRSLSTSLGCTGIEVFPSRSPGVAGNIDSLSALAVLTSRPSTHVRSFARTAMGFAGPRGLFVADTWPEKPSRSTGSPIIPIAGRDAHRAASP